MNAMGSTAPEVILYARAISHSGVLRARRGMKHIPRCGSLDLCSSMAYKLSFSYSKYRILPSPFPATRNKK